MKTMNVLFLTALHLALQAGIGYGVWYGTGNGWLAVAACCAVQILAPYRYER